MVSKCILFDLDGTLTDSGLGIMNCARATFRKYGIPVPEDDVLRTMVGPPLKKSFHRFGIPLEQVDEAVLYYRSLYVDTGKYENFPYPGIRELLEKLTADGRHMFVATSKPEFMSVDILEHFDLAKYFEVIRGSLADGVRDAKSAVIESLLEQIGGAENAVMVGDTVFDVLGANEHRIPTIGVSWGYGNTADMSAAGTIAIADTPQQLYELLSK